MGLYGTRSAALAIGRTLQEYRKSLRPDQVGPTRYAIGTTARPTPGGVSYRPIMGTDPRVRSSATRPAGLRDSSGELAWAVAGYAGGLGADGSRRTKRSNRMWLYPATKAYKRTIRDCGAFSRLEDCNVWMGNLQRLRRNINLDFI